MDHNNVGFGGHHTMMQIAASWPNIMSDVMGNEQIHGQILPQLLHEASEEAQVAQQQQQLMNNQQQIEEINEGDNIEEANDAQLQSMLENYKKHVIKQKQQKPRNRGGGGGADCERSASHLHRKIKEPQPMPVSHSHPCLFLSSDQKNNGGRESEQQQPIFIVNNQVTGNEQKNPSSRPHAHHSSDPRDSIYIRHQSLNPEQNEHNVTEIMNEFSQINAQNEKLWKKCLRLEELEKAYKKIERDYEEVTVQHERRDDLQKSALQKLEQQLRMALAENEQLRAQSSRLSTVFGGLWREGSDEEQQMQHIHFLINDLLPKNEELMLIQERQRIELEAQAATLDEQRTHIEVLEKALANAQERLAAKDRSAMDAVAVVDKCSHLQRMLQEALEDKHRQKEDHGRQVAHLEMELTQLRLQIAKDNNSSAIGSIGRKSGGAMASTGSPESTEELLKLRKTMSQKDERISQLESGLLEMQRRYSDELKQRELVGVTGSKARKVAELETLAMRLELEKAEKERRIHELLDEKCRIQMQWGEERRSLDYRVRLLEKDLRHFMGSQSSLASSGGGGYGYGGMASPYGGDLLGPNSPFSSMRGQNRPNYLRHRSTAELPTSTRGAALYEERGGGVVGMDVMARMEELGRKLAERKAQVREQQNGTALSRPSELRLSSAIDQPHQHDHPSSSPNVPPSLHRSLASHSSSTDQPNPSSDLSPSSEDHHHQQQSSQSPNIPQQPNGIVQSSQRQQPPSAASSTTSSTKKRYFMGTINNNNSPSSAQQFNAYLEQLQEPTRRRLGPAEGRGGFHLLGGIVDGGENAREREEFGGGGGKTHLVRMGAGRRAGEGGCRKLIRDHSIDARREGQQQQTQQLPNYQEAQQQRQPQLQPLRRELGPMTMGAELPQQLPPPAYQQQKQFRQMHQMSSIEEPLQEPPHPPPYTAATATVSGGATTGGGRTVVEVKGGEQEAEGDKGGEGEQGDSDTLNSHRQLMMFRRSSLGNTNVIAK